MRRAFADLFAIATFQGIQMAGRTDRWIINELSRAHGVPTDDATQARILDRYLTHLAEAMGEAGPGKGPLPGVSALLDRLSAHPRVHVGLLTGNVEAGARIKLGHFGLWRYFAGGGFGEAGIERTALFAAALQSVERTCGVRFRADQTVIVGDTPHDIAVAVTSGARSVGVATGGYDREALRESGANAVLLDLSDLDATLDALGLTAA